MNGPLLHALAPPRTFVSRHQLVPHWRDQVNRIRHFLHLEQYFDAYQNEFQCAKIQTPVIVISPIDLPLYFVILSTATKISLSRVHRTLINIGIWWVISARCQAVLHYTATLV